MLAQAQQSWAQLSSDPILLYSLAAAALLVCVSLSSGLGRGDALALNNPRNLVRVLGAIALAFVLRALAEGAVASWPNGEAPGPLAALLPGLHRLPLYLVALAYGPTTGLLSGALFAAFASSTLLPGAPEAVLALELAVLGWLAIYPSPRTTRWAGPLNAGLAYVLAWGTAGVALLASSGSPITLETVVADHRLLLPGLAASLLLLPLFGPAAYRTAFPHSRIGPEYLARGKRTQAGPQPQLAARPEGALARQAELPASEFDTVELTRERSREPLRPALVTHADFIGGRARAPRSRRLGRPALPDDELTR